MCGLQIFAGPPIYHLTGDVISAAAGLVYINLHPEYKLRNSTRFGQFQKFGKIEFGVLSSPATPKEKTFWTGSEFLFITTYASYLTFLYIAPLTSEI